jgi:hypothetical protein
VALVDDDDYELVNQYRWRPMPMQSNQDGFYAATNTIRPHHPSGRINVSTTMRMHNLITGWPRVDHKNHNGLDNRRKNLRPATASQNGGNQRKSALRTSSQFKGVSREDSKWCAQIKVKGVKYRLGLFVAEEDAAQAYNAAAVEAFGEYAHINDMEEAA